MVIFYFKYHQSLILFTQSDQHEEKYYRPEYRSSHHSDCFWIHDEYQTRTFQIKISNMKTTFVRIYQVFTTRIKVYFSPSSPTSATLFFCT